MFISEAFQDFARKRCHIRAIDVVKIHCSMIIFFLKFLKIISKENKCPSSKDQSFLTK